MGQKTHPTGFRIGIIEPWVSTWFANKKKYAEFIAEDAKIRKFVKKNFTPQVYQESILQEKHRMLTLLLLRLNPVSLWAEAVKALTT